jgi:glutamine synthetase type III
MYLGELPYLLGPGVPSMRQKTMTTRENIREQVDHLEMIVEDGLWTLPKYRELLFIR